MTTIPIYNKHGLMVNEVNIKDDLLFIAGRVSKGSRCYYKGVGSHYKRCSTLTPNGYKVIAKNPVFYYGYWVENERLRGKFGIMQEKYQPYFSDFIGSCGPKELAIINNSKTDFSSVKVLDCISYDKDNNQYYFKLDYDCDRVKYVDRSSPLKLNTLLSQVLSEGWNFPWDKGAINDITADGRVSDVADMFQSKKLQHRLGTVYSVLYSLGQLAPQKYYEFVTALKLKHSIQTDYVFNALWLLDTNDIDITGLLPSKGPQDLGSIYKHVVANHLITGRNCAYVEDTKHGDAVKRMFIERGIN